LHARRHSPSKNMSSITDWGLTVADAVEKMIADRRCRPLATYRLQFAKDRLTFRDAADLASYLHGLGISHIYASPYFKTRPGVANCYAIVDYAQLNPELGGEEQYRSLVEALDAYKMGQIIDIVPNHMNAVPLENRWWTDVLENGPGSPFAAYFDIDWRPVKEQLRDRILLPVLGDQYGQILESGELKLQYAAGAFLIRYYQMLFPLDPRTYRLILARRIEELKSAMPTDSDDLREMESILTALEHLPDRNETDPDRVTERQREKEVVKDRLRRLVERSVEIAEFIRQNVRDLNGASQDPQSFDELDKLLDAQVYRLSHWKAAADEINYRRFFDINELAAVCTEDPRVFQESHHLAFDLLVSGDAAGLRIDHIDGLYDPMEYLQRLQWTYLRFLGKIIYDRLRETAAHGQPDSATQGQGGIASQAAGGTGEQTHEPPDWSQVETAFLDIALARLDCAPAAAEPDSSPHLPGERQEANVLLPTANAPEGQGTIATSAEPSSFPLALGVAPSGCPGVRVIPLYVVVEKILGPEEPLPQPWLTEGTTGYDFMTAINGLFVDGAGLRELVKLYDRFTDRHVSFEETAYQSKLLILRTAMSNDLQLLAHRLNLISERHRRSRDFTLNTLRTALRDILTCFPVYRTYIREGEVTDRDRQVIHRATAQAKRRNPAIDAAAFDFIRDVLLLESPPALNESGRRERAMFVGRFQQVTSPVMAKGIEDTAFYRYVPLVSLNEVGGHPARGIATVEDFHNQNLARRAQWPRSLIATTTHDTKRSEDLRARINVLSEVPHLWRKAVNRWARLNRRHRRDVNGLPAPSRNDEYLFYQSLLGIWPLLDPDAETLAHLTERMQAYMEKATHEAKLQTSWISPDAEYDVAVREFVAAAMSARGKNRFLAEFRRFQKQIVEWGLYTAISQTLLKLTSPGVPDIYQGQELWDFSLVDPDNRRPVDFALRRELLDQLQKYNLEDAPSLLALARRLAENPRDPLVKLFVTWRVLQCRRQHAALFQAGDYVPLNAEGSRAMHVCAFAREFTLPSEARPQMAIVIAPRLIAKLTPLPENSVSPPPPLGPAVWEDTRVALGPLASSPLKDLFTGRPCTLQNSHILLADALSDFPVALLTNGP
jgi:(1->4)-alpha-D-glucan 1-alpha-D-glucosylmutase